MTQPKTQIIVPTEVEPLTADETLYARDLMRKHTEAVGFLPDAALRWYADHGCVWAARINDDDVGYMVAKQLKSAPAVSAIIQACIQMDARRMHSGLALVEHAAETARREGRSILQCWCRDDLEANFFWKAAGFIEIMRKPGGERRGREVILYRRQLVPVSADQLMEGIVLRGPGGAFATKDTARTLFDHLDAPADDRPRFNAIRGS